MAVLQCEICGGKLIGKPGGVFECDSCGMEYSTEWAKAKVQEIRGTVKIEGPVEVTGTVRVEGGASADSLLKRGYLALEDSQWEKAKELFDQVLSLDPENAEAYLGLAMVNGICPTRAVFAEKYIAGKVNIGDRNLLRAGQFGSTELKAWLDELKPKRQEAEAVRQRNAEAERQRKLQLLAEKREALAPAAGLIAAGMHHTVGLRTDGTAVAVGSTIGNVCDVGGWTDLVVIAAGDSHTVGLRADGTAVAVGSTIWDVCDVGGWTDVVAIAAGSSFTVGLRSDGTAVAVGHNDRGQCEVSRWTDLVAIAAGSDHTVGLRKDGTAVAVGDNIYGQCKVTGWTDLVAVAAGFSHTVGLRADGTAVAAGGNEYGECDVGGWTDLVAVSAGSNHTVGLKRDGTAVAVGYNKSGQCEVGGWTDLVAVAAGSTHTVGLRANGTVVAVGSNQFGQCSVRGWKLFNSIDTLERELEETREKCTRRLAARQQKIAALYAQNQALQTELANLKGLFSGGRRRELEARLAQIERELNTL